MTQSLPGKRSFSSPLRNRIYNFSTPRALLQSSATTSDSTVEHPVDSSWGPPDAHVIGKHHISKFIKYGRRGKELIFPDGVHRTQVFTRFWTLDPIDDDAFSANPLSMTFYSVEVSQGGKRFQNFW